MSDAKLLPGKFVWFELISSDARRAQAFYAEVLGWKIRGFPMGEGSYDMIFTGDSLDTMIGGFGAPPCDGEPSRCISYVSVDDVDAAARATTAAGGTVVVAPFDLPEVARCARILDPQGAELCLFKRLHGDPPDVSANVPGRIFWNELHTPDPSSALAFYGSVVGFTHQAMGNDPKDLYYILSRDGVPRAGVTSHLPAGTPPHWLPYVEVDNADATLARARKHGASIRVDAMDIPGIGRFGVLADPTGAVLAVMTSFETGKK
jgi:uncharacterized protein